MLKIETENGAVKFHAVGEVIDLQADMGVILCRFVDLLKENGFDSAEAIAIVVRLVAYLVKREKEDGETGD